MINEFAYRGIRTQTSVSPIVKDRRGSDLAHSATKRVKDSLQFKYIYLEFEQVYVRMNCDQSLTLLVAEWTKSLNRLSLTMGLTE